MLRIKYLRFLCLTVVGALMQEMNYPEILGVDKILFSSSDLFNGISMFTLHRLPYEHVHRFHLSVWDLDHRGMVTISKPEPVDHGFGVVRQHPAFETHFAREARARYGPAELDAPRVHAGFCLNDADTMVCVAENHDQGWVFAFTLTRGPSTLALSWQRPLTSRCAPVYCNNAFLVCDHNLTPFVLDAATGNVLQRLNIHAFPLQFMTCKVTPAVGLLIQFNSCHILDVTL